MSIRMTLSANSRQVTEAELRAVNMMMRCDIYDRWFSHTGRKKYRLRKLSKTLYELRVRNQNRASAEREWIEDGIYFTLDY